MTHFIIILFIIFIFFSLSSSYPKEKWDTFSQKRDSPSSIETDSGVSLASLENGSVTEDELNDVSMDVSDRAGPCSAYDEFEQGDSIPELKGPKVK